MLRTHLVELPGSPLSKSSARGRIQVHSSRRHFPCDYQLNAVAGMSLVDQNMVPFQTAYPLVIFLVFCVLAGNTCLVSLIPVRLAGAADRLTLRVQPILYVVSSSFP